MATIKLFESWLQSALNEDYNANPYAGNNAANAEYEQWRLTPAGKQFKLFTDTVSKSGLTSLQTETDYANILFALMKNSQKTKSGFLGIGKVSDDDLVNKTLDKLAPGGGLSLMFFKRMVDYIPSQSGPGYMRTIGKATGDYNVDTSTRYQQTSSFIKYVCNFINYYNVEAYAKGEGQFILTNRLDETGHMDISSAPTINADLYLYSPKLAVQQVATKSVETKVDQVGGIAGVSGNYAADFDQGSAELNDKVRLEVKRAVELCLVQFPAGNRPDKFTLTSGASTEYNKKQMPASNGIGPVSPTNDETKNQDLAYRRGLTFMNALNAGLKASGHPGFAAFEVAWVIGKSGQPGNPADRFVNLELQKNAVKPKAVETSKTSTDLTGTGSESGREKGQLFELILSFRSAGN